MQTVIAKDTPAGSILINCPVCGSLEVPCEIIERQETVMQNMVVPMGTHTTWWVVCSECKSRLYSKLSAAGLKGKSSDELVGQVYYYVSFVNQFLAVAALLLSPFPALGQILALIAWLMNRKTPGWTGKLSKFALRASLAVLALMILYAIIDIAFMHRPHR